MNRAGSFLYEPAGSVHTLQCIEDDTKCGSTCTAPTSTSTPTATSRASPTAPARSNAYYLLGEAAGLPRPNVLVD